MASLSSRAIATARSDGLLRLDHFLHLRCEVPMPDVAEATQLFGQPDVRLASLMDHTPGQRQFRGEASDYYRGKKNGMTDAELDRLFEKRIRYQALYAAGNYAALVKLGRRTRRRWRATTIRRWSTSPSRSRTVSRSRSFQPPSRRRARCMRPASRC
jgi:alpha-D-ribose 1-methylphosphonate 5-triphosphate diphosphatase